MRGNVSGIVISRSKYVKGAPRSVTRKCCWLAGLSGMHWTPRPVRPEAALANQLPGVQLLVRDTDTLKERVQEYGEVPLYWRQTRFSVGGVATRFTSQPL